MENSPVDDLLFRKVFGSTIIAVLSSMLSYLFAQYIDIHIYHFWKNLTKGRMLWLRNNFSTFFSQFVDTFTILFLLCITNVLSWDQFAGLLISGFLFKVLVALVDTPFLYLGVYLFRKKFNLEITTDPNLKPDIKTIVNYENIVNIIKQLTAKKHHELLESMSEEIFDEIFKNHNHVSQPLFNLMKIHDKQNYHSQKSCYDYC